MKDSITTQGKKRIVVIGGGIGGLELVTRLLKNGYQVTLIDKHNYHQFPPLIYQVASAGLEPSSIAFPFRRLFQGNKDFIFRMAEVTGINTKLHHITTSLGEISYDELVIAAGATTNFFGNDHLATNCLPMKTLAQSMHLRNVILENLEKAERETDEARKQALLNVVIVGGGATGVEIAGAIAEMRRYIVPHDYPTINYHKINIYLLNAGSRLLSAMDPWSSAHAERDLTRLGVKVMNDTPASDYSGDIVTLKDGTQIHSKTVIWVSGIRANTFEGIPAESMGHAGRLLTDRMNRVKGLEHVYAIGDVSLVEGDEKYPLGHPQLAQVALQQAHNVADNFERLQRGEELKPFSYHNLGTMATIGRKCAVAEIGGKKFGGLPAWLLWLVVHLRSILGVRNKTVVLLNWIWNYINYRQSLRLILTAAKPN
jgi:NADH dehydrogenase